MNFVENDETLEDLQLKGIKLIQKKQGFRFGVDAVLLSSFTSIKKGEDAIDLCSGTGIIPFLLVGKTGVRNVTGIEIQSEMVNMANRSADYNGLSERLKFISGDLRNNELIRKIPKVSVVTVNPPYKLKDSGIINLEDNNAIARHEICCTLKDVISASFDLLKDNGKLFMVHRPERLVDVFCTMREYRIEPKHVRMVYPKPFKAPSMVLIEAQKYGGRFLKWEPPLFIHEQDGSYTKEILKIYGKEDNDGNR